MYSKLAQPTPRYGHQASVPSERLNSLCQTFVDNSYPRGGLSPRADLTPSRRTATTVIPRARPREHSISNCYSKRRGRRNSQYSLPASRLVSHLLTPTIAPRPHPEANQAEELPQLGSFHSTTPLSCLPCPLPRPAPQQSRPPLRFRLQTPFRCWPRHPPSSSRRLLLPARAPRRS